MTLSDYVFATYNELLTAGWRMNEIDSMDMLGFLGVRAWQLRREKEKKKKSKAAYIDTVWPSLRPGGR